jgi:hypothetical protein
MKLDSRNERGNPILSMTQLRLIIILVVGAPGSHAAGDHVD